MEISLDLDTVSAACPVCHIVLVEGDSASFPDLVTAEDTAVTFGATEVSNTYDGDNWTIVGGTSVSSPLVAGVNGSPKGIGAF